AGLRVIERSQAIAQLLDLLKFGLIGLVSRIVGDAVAFVVKTGRRFRGKRCWRGEDKTAQDKTQDGQRDQESHGSFPLFQGWSREALAFRTYIHSVGRSIVPRKCGPIPYQTSEDEGSFMNTTFAAFCPRRRQCGTV